MLFSAAMPVMGLTGGVATGKSTVAKLFRQCGAAVVDADLLARQVVRPGTPAWRDLVRAFGRGILRPDRSLDRPALARRVFGDRRALMRLNAIVHPRVAREQARLTRAFLRARPRAVIVYDAPVLIEAGAHRRMDHVLVVTADRRTQMARLQRRNRLSRPEALRRIRSQMPLAAKIRLADYVIDGTRPISQLRRDVRRIYDDVKRLGAKRPRPRRKK